MACHGLPRLNRINLSWEITVKRYNQRITMNVEAKTLMLLKPRGFCAVVVRAIDIVRIALDAFGPPIYVRREIVHNRYVVEELNAKGAIFVNEVDEVPHSH